MFRRCLWHSTGSLWACMVVPVVIISLFGCAHDFSVGHVLVAKELIEEKGQYDEAINNAKKSVSIEPSYAPGWYWLGVANFRKAQYDEAIQAFSKVIELKPSGAQYQSSYDFLGWSYYWKGDFKKAISYFNSSLEIKPNDQNSLDGRGWSYYHKGNYENAIKSFNSVLEIKPNHFDALTGKGWSYYKKGNFEKAIRDFNSALEINPNHASTLNARGWAFYFIGNFEKAIKSFNRTIENIASNNKDILQAALRGKAFSYLGLGDSQTAINLINKAKEALDYDTSYDLSLLYYLVGNKAQALKYRGGGGMIGVEIKDYKVGTRNAVKVVKTVPDGPMEKAGVLASDVILKLNNIDIFGIQDLVKNSRKLVPGTIVRIKILREGAEKELKLQVGSVEALMAQAPLIAPIIAKRKSKAFHVEQKPVKPAITLSLTQKISITQRWAVIVGISDYHDTRIPALRYASNDAKSFYEWIISTNGGKHSPARVKLLINQDATGRKIKNALFVWLKQALEEDVVTIFFAGHGSPESPDSPENLFLLPYDAQYDDIATSGFPMWDIETALKRFIKAKKVVVIADACHSGGVGQSYDVVRRANRGIEVNQISSGFQNLSKIGDGVAVLSASDDKQFSQESQKWGGGHGVFTYFLLEGLNGEADYNKDTKVTLGELIPYLSEQVRRATKNAQSPTVAGKFDPALSIGR